MIAKARIEIIPLIDVIFFLLATFVLFTLSLEKLQSVDVNLPRGGPGDDDEPVTLQVSDGGNLYWNRELISLSQLDGQIDLYRRNTRTPRVMIAGDEHASYGSTIEVFDRVRAAGIAQVSVSTAVTPTGK